jgi:hypothetical protein
LATNSPKPGSSVESSFDTLHYVPGPTGFCGRKCAK